MVGQEVWFYTVFIGIDDKPCINYLSYLPTITTLGHFNITILLLLHKTVILTSSADHESIVHESTRMGVSLQKYFQTPILPLAVSGGFTAYSV